MTGLFLTPLEATVLNFMHAHHAAEGVEPASHSGVKWRKNTGGGRYVGLASPSIVSLPDGFLGLDGHIIEMDGLPFGLMCVAVIESGRMIELEFTPVGDVAWDGVERPWRIV